MSDSDDDWSCFEDEDRVSGWTYWPLNFLILIAPMVAAVLLITFSFVRQVGPVGSYPYVDDFVTSSVSPHPLPSNSK